MRRKLARTCRERTRTSASSPFARCTCRAAHGTCLSSLFPNTGTVFLSNRKLCSHAQPNSACTCGERAKTSVQNRRERRSSSARHMCKERGGLSTRENITRARETCRRRTTSQVHARNEAPRRRLYVRPLAWWRLRPSTRRTALCRADLILL